MHYAIPLTFAAVTETTPKKNLQYVVNMTQFQIIPNQKKGDENNKNFQKNKEQQLHLLTSL